MIFIKKQLYLLNNMKYVILAGLILSLMSEASAYIDPGTGGAIIGSMGGIVAAFLGIILAVVLKYFMTPLKKGFSKIKGFLRGK